MTSGSPQQKNSTPEGGWRTVRKPGLKEKNGFERKNLYFPLTDEGSIKLLKYITDMSLM